MFRRPSQALRLRRSRRPGRYHPDVFLLEDRVLLSATSTVFSLDQNNSSLTLSGTYAGANLQQQGTGSLVTKYMGTLVAQWDLTAHTINFIQAGTAATALNSGTWQPAVGGGSGSAAANYGGKATILFVTGYAAVRGLVAATSSNTLALSGGGPSYSFPSSETLTITAGFADYRAGSFGSGRTDLSNNSATNTAAAGTFQDLANGAYRVTAPISVTINKTIGGQSAVLHIIGTVVANATIPVVMLGHGTPDYSTSVVATQGPKNITDPAATLTDANGSASLTSMTVTLTNHPDGAQELLAANLTGTGLSGSYNSSTGVETITGRAAPAVYQTVLRSLTYENRSATPNTANRIIQVVVSDGTNASVVRTSTVSVSAPATHFAVAGFPSPVVAGVAGSVTVTALDSSGHTATGYRGTVHFTSSDFQAGLPANYTFTASDNGVHTFSATLKSAGTRSITATDTATASITGTQSGIVVNPAATANFLISGYPTLVVAGTAFNITITARDAYGNTTPGYTGTVTFSSSDGQATLPANSTLTNGVGMFGVTLGTAGSQTVTATDTTNGAITGNATINVGPGILDHFAVTTSADGSGTVAGSPFDVSVTAQDAYNNTLTGYTGTVTFSSQDPYGASLPADYAFQPSDMGQVTFAAGAALYTAGTWDVTASDTATGLSGSDYVAVTAAAATSFQIIAPATATSGQAFDITVIATDPYGNTDTNYQGTVTFSSSDGDPGVVLPADYTFQASDQGIVTFAGGVTLITPGDQSITATDVDSGITGSAIVTVNSPGPGAGGTQHARRHTALDGLFAGAWDRWDAHAWAAPAETAFAHRGPPGHPVDAVLMDELI